MIPLDSTHKHSYESLLICRRRNEHEENCSEQYCSLQQGTSQTVSPLSDSPDHSSSPLAKRKRLFCQETEKEPRKEEPDCEIHTRRRDEHDVPTSQQSSSHQSECTLGDVLPQHATEANPKQAKDLQDASASTSVTTQTLGASRQMQRQSKEEMHCSAEASSASVEKRRAHVPSPMSLVSIPSKVHSHKPPLFGEWLETWALCPWVCSQDLTVTVNMEIFLLPFTIHLHPITRSSCRFNASVVTFKETSGLRENVNQCMYCKALLRLSKFTTH